MNNVNQEAGARKRGRVELKRMETRSRIIAATERLLSARPIDDVTLQDITQAAAIGHGSFYLHFKSKYEVLIPIVQARAAQVDGQLRTALAGNDDPAQIMAFSTRVMARMIVSDPLWRWFLSHSGVPVEEMRRAFGRFSNRDFQAGLASGRFQVPDIDVVGSYGFGGFVNALLASFNVPQPEPFIDAMAETMLRVFGIADEEARVIAHLPLPDEWVRAEFKD